MTLSREKKLDAVELAVRAACWRRPDSRIVDRPGWFKITTPSSKNFWFNGVLDSSLSAEEAPRLVAETVAEYRELGAAFRWRLGPRAEPADLDRLLEQAGLKLHHRSLGMVAEIGQIVIDVHEDVSVVRATLENVEDYVTASIAGWSNPPEVASEMLVDMRRSLADRSHATLYYIAYLEGRPVGTGALLPLETSAYLLGGSVAPEARGKGVYRALVARRFDELKAMGIGLATIQAMAETSAPICRRLGFETVCEMRGYLG